MKIMRNYDWNYEKKNSFFSRWILVGAGTTGCVVASRLADHKQWRVLLLEAGPGEMFSHTFPMVQIADPQATFLDWNFTTVPQTHSGAGMTGRVSVQLWWYVITHADPFWLCVIRAI